MGKRESYLVTSAGIALIMSLPLPVIAQTAPAEQETAAPQPSQVQPGAGEQDVIVTGSRLRSPTLTAPAPVQVIPRAA